MSEVVSLTCPSCRQEWYEQPSRLPEDKVCPECRHGKSVPSFPELPHKTREGMGRCTHCREWFDTRYSIPAAPCNEKRRTRVIDCPKCETGHIFCGVEPGAYDLKLVVPDDIKASWALVRGSGGDPSAPPGKC